MAEKIYVENGRISNFEGLVTLTLHWVILHTVCHASLVDLYLHAKFHWNWGNVFGQTYVHADGRTMPISKSRDTKSRTD